MPKQEKLPPLLPNAPPPKAARYREQYGITIVCDDQKAQAQLYEALLALRTAKIKVVAT